MNAGTVLLLLVLLACPLLMWRMHRGGGHGHGSTGGSAGDEHAGHGCGHGGHGSHAGHESGECEESIDELRRKRDELDAEIQSREQATEPPLR